MKQVELKVDTTQLRNSAHLGILADELKFRIRSQKIDPYGEHIITVEFDGDMPEWPEELEIASAVRTLDPIDPSRAMPDNYDPEQMARILVRDKELARTCAPDVVQRLAQELLNALKKLKELEDCIDGR